MNERRWCTLAAVGETLCSNSFFAGLFLLKRKRGKSLFWHDRWLDGQMNIDDRPQPLITVRDAFNEPTFLRKSF